MRSFLIVGGCRGLGLAIAQELAAAFPGSEFVLTGRQAGVVPPDFPGTPRVVYVPWDMSKADDAEAGADRVLSAWHHRDRALTVVFNAGTLGVLDVLSSPKGGSAAAWGEALTTNVTSTAVLLSRCLNLPTPHRLTLVNISSKAAVAPFVSWSQYCAGKAARDMLFAVAAVENPLHRILNYAPGPLDTDMQKEIREECLHEETRKAFAGMKADGKLLDPNVSAKRMVAILKADNFASGAHIDFFDKE
jgi:sepiapterin reductase